MAESKVWLPCKATVTIEGIYEVSDGWVTVRCAHGKKDMELRSLPEDHVTRTLLSEMARGLPGTDTNPDCRFIPPGLANPV